MCGLNYRKLPLARRFLVSFFVYNMAVQTVMYVATIFGSDELKLPGQSLIITILLIQLVAIPGAYGFSRLSERVGNTHALMTAVVIWIGVLCRGLLRANRNAVFRAGGCGGPGNGRHSVALPLNLFQTHSGHDRYGFIFQFLRRDRKNVYRVRYPGLRPD